MPELRPCSRNELTRNLKALGFSGPFSGGRHSYLKRDRYRQIIPNPHGKDISSEFIKEMLKQAGIPLEEWLKA
jgi:predicted RNA binding protein YcfA (HicA-like mRNA interferase family)